MKAKWFLSRYQEKPLSIIWYCHSCGNRCEKITPLRVKPDGCADIPKSIRIQQIRKSLGGYNGTT